MDSMHLERYNSTKKGEWDKFVDESRNGTFLFKRDYMDYHSDRFRDCSLMVYKGGSLRALLPCNITEEDGVRELHSHQGLTYGGWILPTGHLNGEDVEKLFSLLGIFCKKEGIIGVDYKCLPDIYARVPSEEDRYALFRLGAERVTCELSSTIRLSENPGFNTLQRRHLRKAEREGENLEVRILESDEELREFYGMLQSCLLTRYAAAPVHTFEELLLLYRRFPENIRFVGCFSGERMHAGVVLYITPRVVHTQYICSTEEGRKKGFLSFLFEKVISEGTAGKEYFDFGTSNGAGGLFLNTGLLRQKFSLGGTGVVHERYYVRNFFRNEIKE